MTRTVRLLNEAANAAFQNSVDLLEEAKILSQQRKWARSYALTVLAAEQFTKSFEFKCEQAGRNLPPVPKKGIHGFRLQRFTFLLIAQHLMSVGQHNFLAKLACAPLREADRKFIRSVYVMLGKDADKRKEAAFYVDLNGKVRIPSKEVQKKECEETIKLMEGILKNKPNFLIAQGEQLNSELNMNYFPLFERAQGDLSKMIGTQFMKR